MSTKSPMHYGKCCIEIRTYQLHPGVRETFHQLMVQDALPLLDSYRVDVVAFGPSAHDTERYYLMRTYANAETRQISHQAVYDSAEWQLELRSLALPLIARYTTTVIELSDATVNPLKQELVLHQPKSSGCRVE